MNNRRLMIIALFTVFMLSIVLLSGCGRGAVDGSNLPRGFPKQTPLLPGNIILSQHEKAEGAEWYFINFEEITETDPDAYITRIRSQGWEEKSFTDLGGGWIISATYRSEYVLQASVFYEEKVGILVVTTDLDAY
jgi:hypothetical protein